MSHGEEVRREFAKTLTHEKVFRDEMMNFHTLMLHGIKGVKNLLFGATQMYKWAMCSECSLHVK